MENIINLINSKHWVIITSTDDEVIFATERHEYTISKRPILGYRLTVSSPTNIERNDTIFKDADELIEYIKSNKQTWEEKGIKPIV